jgi:hypothetical protein
MGLTVPEYGMILKPIIQFYKTFIEKPIFAPSCFSTVRMYVDKEPLLAWGRLPEDQHYAHYGTSEYCRN